MFENKSMVLQLNELASFRISVAIKQSTTSHKRRSCIKQFEAKPTLFLEWCWGVPRLLRFLLCPAHPPVACSDCHSCIAIVMDHAAAGHPWHPAGHCARPGGAAYCRWCFGESMANSCACSRGVIRLNLSGREHHKKKKILHLSDFLPIALGSSPNLQGLVTGIYKWVKVFWYYEGRDTRVSQTRSERQTRSFVRRRFAVYGIFNSSTLTNWKCRRRQNVFEQNFLFVAHFVSGKPLCPALQNIKMRVSSKKSFTLLKVFWNAPTSKKKISTIFKDAMALKPSHRVQKPDHMQCNSRYEVSRKE